MIKIKSSIIAGVVLRRFQSWLAWLMIVLSLFNKNTVMLNAVVCVVQILKLKWMSLMNNLGISPIRLLG